MAFMYVITFGKHVGVHWACTSSLPHRPCATAATLQGFQRPVCFRQTRSSPNTCGFGKVHSTAACLGSLVYPTVTYIVIQWTTLHSSLCCQKNHIQHPSCPCSHLLLEGCDQVLVRAGAPPTHGQPWTHQQRHLQKATEQGHSRARHEKGARQADCRMTHTLLAPGFDNQLVASAPGRGWAVVLQPILSRVIHTLRELRHAAGCHHTSTCTAGCWPIA